MCWWKEVLGSWYAQQSYFSIKNKLLKFEFNKLAALHIKDLFKSFANGLSKKSINTFPSRFDSNMLIAWFNMYTSDILVAVAFLIKLGSSFFIDFDKVSILISCNQHLHHQISDCYQQKLDQIHFHSPYCHYPGLMHLHHGSVVFGGQVAHPLPSHPSKSTTPSFSPSLPFLNL